MTTKPTFDYTKYVNELISKQQTAANAAFRRVKEALETSGYSKMTLKDDKTTFLCSASGQALLEEASKEKVNFAQLAQLLNFTQKELHTLAREHDEIYDSIDRGQSKQYDDVEKALNKLATGYYIDEVTEFENTDDRGRTRKDTRTAKRYIMPSFAAQAYVLNNKRQMEFYDRQVQAEQEKNTVHLVIEFVNSDDVPRKTDEDD